jgi:hypothetical protein
MKRTSSLLIILSIVCASVAHGGDVKIDATVSTGPEDDPTTTFAVDTPNIFAYFETKGLQNGDKLRGVWIAEDVGDAAPKETKIFEKTLNAEGDIEDGVFSLSKPTNGWPVGKYRLEIYVGDKLAQTVKFMIQAGKPSKGGEKEESSDD